MHPTEAGLAHEDGRCRASGLARRHPHQNEASGELNSISPRTVVPYGLR
jgi:hypothetical protein